MAPNDLLDFGDTAAPLAPLTDEPSRTPPPTTTTTALCSSWINSFTSCKSAQKSPELFQKSPVPATLFHFKSCTAPDKRTLSTYLAPFLFLSTVLTAFLPFYNLTRIIHLYANKL